MRFGERIKAERKKGKLTAEALAKICGVSRSYVTLIENNQRLPSSKVMPKMAQALNLNTSVILNWYLDEMREKVQKKFQPL